MDAERLLEVLAISLPVFLVIGAGKLLGRAGILTPDRRAFVNWTVYHLALPALIFAEVARQRFDAFLNGAMAGAPLVAIFAVLGMHLLLARRARLRGGRGASFVFGGFWANITYLGFPLALRAFGEEGLARAAVYNALIMPAEILLGYFAIGLYTTDTQKAADAADASATEAAAEAGTKAGAPTSVARREGWGAHLAKTFLNPILLAAVLGVAAAAVAEPLRGEDGALALPGVALAGLRVVEGVLGLLGEMGLPLALLAIGASLHAEAIRRHVSLLAVAAVSKLLLVPALTWAAIVLLWPGTPAGVTGVAVLLGAMPTAVGSYVIAGQTDADEEFVASLLVVTTLAAVLTVPAWLYLLL